MSATHENILQLVRGWVLLATSLPGARVIPVDDHGTRPAMTYITVGLATFDLGKGTDEVLLDVVAGDLRERVRGDRQATITLNAYGSAGADLLALCHISLFQTNVKNALHAAKLTITSAGQTQDISNLVDTGIEKRFVKDFFLDYAVETAAVAAAQLETLTLDVELADNPQYTNAIKFTVEK